MNIVGLQLDEHQQELVPFYSHEFRYRCLHAELNMEHSVTWHWHDALEFVHIVEGTAVFNLPQIDLILPEDSILIINSGVFHGAGNISPGDRVKYHTQMVSPEFLAGEAAGVIRAKYFDPVMRQASELPYHMITLEHPQHAQFKQLLEGSYDAAQGHDLMYELRIRQNLTQIWLLFIESTQNIWLNATPKNDVRSDRIKQMLSFIQENCTDKLTLDQIAESAGISTRECLRCFQSMLKMTPFEYLTDCRVRKAADMLANTSSSMLDIALDCGFSTPSYFCRMFKRQMGQSPSEYKRAHSRVKA